MNQPTTPQTEENGIVYQEKNGKISAWYKDRPEISCLVDNKEDAAKELSELALVVYGD